MNKLIKLFFTISAFSTVTLADVEINEDNFPDANFRNIVLEIDQNWNGNGILEDLEMRGVYYFSVSDSDISDLKGIEYFTSIVWLDCSGNKLSYLDVSKNTSLQELICQNNYIPETKLPQINGNLNKISAYPQYGILINEYNFPDSIFRDWILAQSYGKDSALTYAEITEITNISVPEKDISSLKGIEYFTALEYLYC